MSLAMRLKAYAPNGASLGILPAPQSVQAAMPFGDVGGVEVAYPKAAPKASALAQPCEIAVEVSYDDGATWVEPDDGRFLRLVRRGDTVETPELRTYSGPAYVWRLAKARVLPEGALNSEGKRPFLTKNAGAIMRTLTNEAQARGALSGMDFTTFSEANDSNGAPWTQVVTLYYEPGLDYLTVLLNLQAQGMLDFKMVGRSLRIYNGDTVMAGDSGATLQRGRDLTEAPYTGTMEGLADFVYLAGDSGVSLSRTNAGATAPWGRWESFISQGGVSDTGTMTILTDSALELSAVERVENTYGLDFALAKSLPFRDYGLGKNVKVRDGEGVPVSLRCRQITLTRDERGRVGGNVVLNDRFLENEVRQSRRVQGITGGSTADGGTGARPAPDLPDHLAPKAPTALSFTSDSYLDDEGKVWATVTLSWDAPTQNTDNTALTDLAGYEVFYRLLGGTEWTSVGPATGLVHTSGSHFSNTDYQFAVQAIDNDGNRSAFSAALGVHTDDDATVPFPPSQPVVTPYLGQLLIEWDGLCDTNANGTGDSPPPNDFAAVEIHIANPVGFVPSAATLLDVLTDKAGGSSVATGLTYGSLYTIKLVMVDRSGNRSGESFYTLAIPNKAASGDIESITANQITAGAISAAITISGRIATSLTGQRVELNNTGLKAYDAAGVNTVAINTDGSAVITGTYQSATTGRRVELSTAALSNAFGEDGQHSLKWYPASLSAGWSAAGILPVVTTSGANQGNGLYLQGSTKAASPFTSGWIYLGMDNLSLGVTTAGGYNTGISLYQSGATAEVGIASSGNVTMGNGPGLVMINGSVTLSKGVFTIFGKSGGGTLLKEFVVGASTDTLYSPLAAANTTTAAATLHITTGGAFYRSTSLEAAKVNIDRGWAPDLDTLRSLAPATFHDRRQAEEYAAALGRQAHGEDVDDVLASISLPRQQAGLIAEDVQALGLEWLLHFGEDGSLAGVQYERLAVALIPWLRSLEERLDALESNADALGSTA